jgi:hypothetical protein
MTHRRHRSAAILLAVLGCVLAAGTATAQYQVPAPVPLGPVILPPEGGVPDNQGGAVPGLIAPTTFGSGWEKQLVVGGAWENNVGFVTPTGPDDFFGSLQASLGYWFRNTRQTFRLVVDGDGALYAQLHNHNRLDGSGTLNWTSRLSPATSLTLSGGAASAHSDTQDILVGQGIVLPPVQTKSGNAHLGLTTRLGQRTNATIDGFWQRMTFDSTLYLPTTDWTGSLSVSRTLSQQDTLTARGSYVVSLTTVSRRQLPSLMLDLVHNLASGLSLTAGAGAGHDDVTPLEPGFAATQSWQFTGTAGASGRIRRTTLSAVYTHGLQATPAQAYNDVVDQLTLSVTMPLGRWWQVLAGGAGSYRRQPQTLGDFHYRTADVFAGVSRTLGREASLALEYRYRNRSQAPAGSIRNDRASASLIWTPGRPAPLVRPAR